MVRIESEVFLAQEFRADPAPANVSLPIFRSAFLRLDFASVEVHVEHAELRFDGPALRGDKGASLLNDSLPSGATLLWNPVLGPIVIVTVRLMGPYRRAAGITDDITVTPEEPNLGGVLQAIATQFPEAGKKLQPVAGKVEPAVRVVVNDVVQQGVTLTLPLKDGDRVAFVPIVGGGDKSP